MARIVAGIVAAHGLVHQRTSNTPDSESSLSREAQAPEPSRVYQGTSDTSDSKSSLSREVLAPRSSQVYGGPMSDVEPPQPWVVGDRALDSLDSRVSRWQ